MSETRERYWCANYACAMKDYCMRFVSDENPIEFVKNEGHKNYLQPFVNGSSAQLFHPSSDGKCRNFIQDPECEFVKNYHI